jgi:hypothetical protein
VARTLDRRDGAAPPRVSHRQMTRPRSAVASQWNPAVDPLPATDDDAGSRRGGRKESFLDRLFAKLDPNRIVDVEDGNGDAPDCCPACEVTPLPSEVMGPFVSTRVEQGYQLAGLRVSSRDVRPFVAIIVETG